MNSSNISKSEPAETTHRLSPYQSQSENELLQDQVPKIPVSSVVIGALLKTPTKKRKFRFSSVLSPFFLCIFVVPNLLSIGYYGYLAAPEYDSTANLLVNNPQKDSDSLTTLLAGNAGASTSGAWILKDYVDSWDEFQAINRKIDIAKVWQQGDVVAKYGGLRTLFKQGDISLWRYYQSMVRVDIDSHTGIAQLDVIAFNPSVSHQIATTVVSDAFTHLNELNRAEDADFIRSADQQTSILKAAIADDEKDLATFRLQVGYYDPEQDYASLIKASQDRDSKWIDLDSQYLAIIKLTPNNPVAGQLLTQMNVLAESARTIHLAASGMATIDSTYDTLVLRRNTHAALLQAAETALQEAKIKASQNHYYLSQISEPSLPEDASGPDRLYWIAVIFAATFILSRILM